MARVQRRYAQDCVLLNEINKLSLARVVSIKAAENIADDGYLAINLETTLRDNRDDITKNEDDTLTTPLQKYKYNN